MRTHVSRLSLPRMKLSRRCAGSHNYNFSGGTTTQLVRDGPRQTTSSVPNDLQYSSSQQVRIESLNNDTMQKSNTSKAKPLLYFVVALMNFCAWTNKFIF